jgi:hypothetical protein
VIIIPDWHPGRQTRGRRIIPVTQAKTTTVLTVSILPKPAATKRRFHPQLMDGTESGAPALEIIGIGAIEKNGKTGFFHTLPEERIDPEFAEITTIFGIINKFFPGEGLQIENLQLDPSGVAVVRRPVFRPFDFSGFEQFGSAKQKQDIAGSQSIKGGFHQQ